MSSDGVQRTILADSTDRFSFQEGVIPYHFIKYEATPPKARIVLDRPDAWNQVNGDMAAELRQVCQQIQQDDSIRLVILTGAGDVFSVGREPVPLELSQASAGARRDWIEERQAAQAIASLAVPVVVAINGDAIDHGLELALAGDIRLCSAKARLGLTDLSRNDGSFPWDGGTQRLPRLVGPAWAKDMLLTSRLLDAEDALSIGLVNRAAPPGQPLREEVERVAQAILAGGPVAARYAKEAVQQGLDLPLAAGLGLEADLNIILQSTADRAEGIRSFLERRPPKFRGQ